MAARNNTSCTIEKRFTATVTIDLKFRQLLPGSVRCTLSLSRPLRVSLSFVLRGETRNGYLRKYRRRMRRQFERQLGFLTNGVQPLRQKNIGVGEQSDLMSLDCARSFSRSALGI